MDIDEVRRKRRRLFSTSMSGTSEISVIDLTESSPEPEAEAKHTDARPALDDEAYARELQARFDAEDDDEVTYEPAAGSSRGAGPAPNLQPDSTSLDDQALARQLHAQWNGESVPSIPAKSTLRSKDVEHSLHTFYHSIQHVKCQRCRKCLFRTEKDTLKQFDLHMHPSAETNGRMVCTACQHVSKIDDDRLNIIWVLLCGFDERSKHNKPDKKKGKRQSSKSSSAIGSGTGYGGLRSSKASSAQNQWHGALLSIDAQLAQLTQQKASKDFQSRQLGRSEAGDIPAVALNEDDEMTARVFDCLTPLLPSFEKHGQFDLDPPAEQLQCMLQGSSLLERAAELLRNNNVEEVIQQAKLYTSLVRFLRALAQHTSTSVVVLRERVVRSPGVSIRDVSLGKVDLVSAEEHDNTQPLAKAMRDLAIQCKTMMRSPEISDSLLQTFHAIVELHDFLMTNAGGEAPPTLGDKNTWQKEFAVSEVVDEVMIAKHSLFSKGAGADGMQRGRMTRIVQEIARLQANLPDGIFVRYAASRPDVMKAMIVGPKDTPYENGLFEFDLLCGANFPNEPPTMNFRTTAGGTVHFNPNLYANGKVCLSLLGTWAGESWDPKQSTLLQVLISIQAMIFCESPWNNEPGRENTPNGDVNSKAYNRSLYPNTVRTAMLDWLDRCRYKDGDDQTRSGMFGHMRCSRYGSSLGEIDNDADIWDELVNKHFEVNAKDIVAKVTKWAAEKPATPSTIREPHGLAMPDWLQGATLSSAGPPSLTSTPPTAGLNWDKYQPSQPTTTFHFGMPAPLHFGMPATYAQSSGAPASCPTSQAEVADASTEGAPELAGEGLAAKLRKIIPKLEANTSLSGRRYGETYTG